MPDQVVSQTLHVDPSRVINVLKGRLTEEMSKSALLEAALQESQEREQSLLRALTEQQRQIEEAKEAEQTSKGEEKDSEV